jgi:hypothetical protein
MKRKAVKLILAVCTLHCLFFKFYKINSVLSVGQLVVFIFVLHETLKINLETASMKTFLNSPDFTESC